MKIRVTDGVLIKGKAYRRGDELDVDPVLARMLEQMRRAVQVKESPPAAEPEPETAEPEAVEPEPRGLSTESFPIQNKQSRRHKKGY